MRIVAKKIDPKTSAKEFAFSVGVPHARLEQPSIVEEDGQRIIKFVVKDDINSSEIHVSWKVSDEIYDHYDGNVVDIMNHVATINESFQYELGKLKSDLAKIMDSSSAAEQIKSVQESYSAELSNQHDEITTTVRDNHEKVVDLVVKLTNSNEDVVKEESDRVISHIQEKSGEVVAFTSDQSDSIKEHITTVMDSSREVLKNALEQTTDVKFLTDILVSELTNNLNRQLYKSHKDMVEESAKAMEQASTSSLKRTTELESVLSTQLTQASKLTQMVNTLVEKVDDAVTRLDKTTKDLDRVNALIEKLEGALDD